MTNDGLLFSDPAQPGEEDWDGIAAEAPVDENALYLELDGWEGPLDLLLDLARRQKVDLRSISILSLVDQYLDYIDQAEALKLELAADYLVMAAWLAYLKSAMLLPKEEQEDPSPTKRVEVELPKLPAPGLALHKHRLEWSKPSSTRELIAEEGVRAAGVMRRKRRPGKSSLAASMPRAEEGSSWIKG